MRKIIGIPVAVLCLSLILAGCGGGGGAKPQPDVNAGKVTLRGTVYAPQGVEAGRTAGRTANASPTGKDVPVPDARVSAYRMKNDGTLEEIVTAAVSTLADGSYSLPGAPQEDNIVVVASKNVTVNGETKNLMAKKAVSVSGDDVTAGQKTGIDADVATTLAVEAMKDIVITANQGKPENEKIAAASLPYEAIEDIETKIVTGLTADQAETTPSVNLLTVVTEGSAGTDSQLTGLENSSNGAVIKTEKENASTKGNVRVNVVEINDQGPPIQGATVILTVDGDAQSKTTDEKGKAFFDGIEPGVSVTIEVIKEGYVMESTSQNIEHAAVVNNVVVHMTTATTNQAPVAKAGPDQAVPQNTSVTLDGSASFDPDGNAITYAWTQTSGPAVTLSGATAVTAAFTPTQGGTYVFQLVVSDGSMSSAPDSVSVIVQDSVCGNGVIESGEQCDDGNTTTETCAYGLTSCTVCGSSCTNVAGATSYCGDGTVNGTETCDDGANNGQPNHCNGTCDGTVPANCGNSIVESGENCDDGNTTTEVCAYGQTSCTVCNSSCQSAAGAVVGYCGDSTIQSGNGETCDDGANNGQPNYCNDTCNGTTGSVCGNSVVESGETCDDGNTVTEACIYGQTSCSVCNSSCASAAGALTGYCGDSTIQAGNGETCDDGANNGQPNYCNATCNGTTGSVCGNSVVEAGETCDDGNTTTETCTYGQTSCSVCNSSCQSAAGATSYCGDSTTDAGNGEICDDGNTTTETCTYGQTSCTVCNATCQSAAGVLTGYCGDSTVQSGNGETCDDGANNGQPNYCNATCDGTVPFVCSQVGWKVMTKADSGDGSLRACITEANTAAGAQTITFDNSLIGQTIALASSLPAISDTTGGTTITNTTGGEITVSGNNGDFNCFTIQSAGNTIRGLTIIRCASGGPNRIGIHITGANAQWNTVAGNYIGTNSASAAGLGNDHGVYINNDAKNNIIGGTAPSERNIISGGWYGLYMEGNQTKDNEVVGNYIGTNVAGTSAISNNIGIFIHSQNNKIERNIISGNTLRGIWITYGSGNKITGNYIGLNAAGNIAIGNSVGVMLSSYTTYNTIGGNITGERNIISGNEYGMEVIGYAADYNRIIGNYIGTDETGTSLIGNSSHAIYIHGVPGVCCPKNNKIGGVATDEANLIAYNGGAGVYAEGVDTDFNTISQNQIYENTGLGIDLDGAGANDDIAAPVITTVTPNGANYDVSGTVTCPAYPCAVELFRVDDSVVSVTSDPSGAGEGYEYISSTSVAAGVNFSFTNIPISSNGTKVTATLTDANGNTSEFAQNKNL